MRYDEHKSESTPCITTINQDIHRYRVAEKKSRKKIKIWGFLEIQKTQQEKKITQPKKTWTKDTDNRTQK